METLGRTMRRTYLEAPQRLVLREVPVPAPEPGQVLVRVHVALTCGTDLKTYRRGHARLPIPGPFGHEGAGEVVAVGEGVEDFRPGDRVVWLPTAPCGACRACGVGRGNLCARLFEPDRLALGTYADGLLLPAQIVRRHLFLIPPDVPDRVAALLEPLACAVRGANRLGRVDDVLVIGGGPMGLLLGLVLQARGASVTLLARRPAGAVCARAFGVAVVEGSLEERTAELRALRPGGFAGVVECTGHAAVWEAALQFVAPGGRLLLFGGLPSGTHVPFDAYRLHYEEVDVFGSFHYDTEDAQAAYRLLPQLAEQLVRLVTHTHPLDGIVSLFEALDRGMDALKVAVVPDARRSG